MALSLPDSDLFSRPVVLGIDEAGRGPLAGPVVAAGVILDEKKPVVGLNDSKKLTEKAREGLYQEIMEHAIFVGVEEVEALTIDQVNILQATLMAMHRVLLRCLEQNRVDLVLVDGDQIIGRMEGGPEQRAIIKGDGLVPSIMAASIIAKVHRDRMMKDFAQRYPVYGFEKHKGYGTRAHLSAIAEHGPCPIHRRSFAPLRENAR